MTSTIPPFPSGTLESVCKIIGGLYSGAELTGLLSEVPLHDDPAEGIGRPT